MLRRDYEDLKEDVSKHHKDLYFGNGLPGLTTRVANIEQIISILKWGSATSILTFLSFMGWMASQLWASLHH